MSELYNTSQNDKSIFRRTASRTKKVNIKPKLTRGGTRF
nr:MAG TPA: hypothetical protein [Microviridae sp.]